MTTRPAWFVYARPRRGKISARPVHPIGWMLLAGVPVPGMAVALFTARAVGPVIATVASLAVTAMALWVLFRLVVRRGVPARPAD